MAEIDSTMMSNAATGYKYTPLEGAQSFRLLQILPAVEDSEEIHCKIEEFDRESELCPPYIALSYTWGDANVTIPITLNGQPLSVTTNLHSALMHMRRMMPNIMVWIDAISIDQEHPEERGHQVAQMRAIYSDAKRVIIWLGPAPDWGNVAQLFEEMEAHHRLCPRDFTVDGACASFYGPESARLLHYLGDLSYWTRIWIVQEIVVAKRVVVMCGGGTIGWRMFAYFVKLAYYGHFVEPGEESELVLQRPNLAPTIINLMHWRLKGVTLADALSRTSECQATDYRDKVYAILGLVDIGVGQQLEADYTLSFCVVLRKTIFALYKDSIRLISEVRTVDERLAHMDWLGLSYYSTAMVGDGDSAAIILQLVALLLAVSVCPEADRLLEQLFPLLWAARKESISGPERYDEFRVFIEDSPCNGNRCQLEDLLKKTLPLARGR
jgi:hypothetical protein